LTPELFPLAEIYLQVKPREIGFVKAIFESYESVGIVRTIDPDQGIIVVMVPTDFLVDAGEILNSLRDEVEWTEVSRPKNFADDWLMRAIHAKDD
jgi:hypothetical protein